MSDKYKEVFLPNHPRAMATGYVYEHILVAEQVLGRPIDSNEVVHHKDEDKKNNSPDNIMVFDSRSSHSSFHMGGTLVQNDDGTYTTIRKIEIENPGTKLCRDPDKCICPVCGINEKSIDAEMCSSCRLEYRRRNVPSKEDLINKSLSLNCNKEALARFYGVSGKSIAKWYKIRGLKDAIIHR